MHDISISAPLRVQKSYLVHNIEENIGMADNIGMFCIRDVKSGNRTIAPEDRGGLIQERPHHHVHDCF